MKGTIPFALAALLAGPAHASIAVFNDLAVFQTATGAVSATGALPSLPGVYSAVTVGDVTFSGVNGWAIYVGGLEAYTPSDWSSLLPGNEIAVNYVENLDAVFDTSVFSAGFMFVEPGANSTTSAHANNAYYPSVDSTFTVTLMMGGTVVDQFNFNRPEETASFVGVWSSAAFDRLEIRETIGATEDDYFGEFYSGTVAMPVPEPETYALMLAGLGLVGFAARRMTN